jgi:RNA polymerase sigma-70 factor (ECF subfamily)
VRNLAIDNLRRNRRTTPIPAGPDGIDYASEAPDPGETASRRDAAQAAMGCLSLLSDRDREVVVLKVFEEKSYKEIAALMDLSIGNVGFILHKAIHKMAASLQHKLALDGQQP